MFSFRYQEMLNARNFLISACGLLQDKKIIFLKENFEDCYNVLKSSHIKGQFIEQFVACPAWSPILSIESTDGQLWKKLQTQFKKIFKTISWRTKIPVITEKTLIDMAQDPEYNSAKNSFIRNLICSIMFELLFEKKPSKQQQQLFCQASIEWSKEIAMRGSANPTIKKNFWDELSGLLEDKFKISDLTSDEQTIFISAIAQPFIISPMINFSDIFASFSTILKKEPTWTEWLKNPDNQKESHHLHFMLECIRIHHPFPILERELIKDLTLQNGRVLTKGMQVFILVDTFLMEPNIHLEYWQNEDQHIMKSFIFGTGARSCLGQHMAELLLSETLKGLISHDITLTNFDQNLTFSGRVNDHKTIPGETMYQIKRARKILAETYALRNHGSSMCPAQYSKQHQQELKHL